MKTPTTALLILLLPASLSLAEGTLETWNDLQGRSFEAEIVSVKPGLVRLRNAEGKEIDFPTAYLVPQGQARVREWEQAEKAAREPSEFAKTFQKDLMKRDGKKVGSYDPEDLGKVKYFAFYFSASWCPPCRQFTPKLVDFYTRVKKDHPEFELIFVSSDRSKDATKDYMVNYKMPWPAFEQGKHKNLVSSYGGGIPCLVVTDADGKKLMDSYTKSGKYTGPTAVMQKLEALLKDG